MLGGGTTAENTEMSGQIVGVNFLCRVLFTADSCRLTYKRHGTIYGFGNF